MDTENIKQMQKRHEKEIKELQADCKHKKLSECMPDYWAIAHFSGHCVKVCEKCGIEIKTTYKGGIVFEDDFKTEKYLNPTSKDKLFKCPEREDCMLIIQRKEEKDR